MVYDVIIIGGGIVGLATAYQILQKEPALQVLVLEKENEVSKHQTGHNSGVIHSGIYYKPGSLKAQNCIEGYKLLIDFCEKFKVPYELCGKVIVATNENEIQGLESLFQRGLENGLSDLRMLDSHELKKIEPHISGVKAIKVPQTGIVDYKMVSHKLQEIITTSGGQIIFGAKVSSILEKDSIVNVSTTQAKTYASKCIVNCAGLYSDKVAGFHFKELDTKIIPFRGEYFKLNESAKKLINHLVYPVPDPNFPFLGVHFTRMIDGNIEAGPNAVFAFKREGYSLWSINIPEMIESLLWPGFQLVMKKYWRTGFGEIHRSLSKKAFTKALQKLLPSIKESDLTKAPAGVRAQACDISGGLLDDFKIIEKSNAIHVINAPSPAATSSLSIGQTISDKVLALLNNIK